MGRVSSSKEGSTAQQTTSTHHNCIALSKLSLGLSLGLRRVRGGINCRASSPQRMWLARLTRAHCQSNHTRCLSFLRNLGLGVRSSAPTPESLSRLASCRELPVRRPGTPARARPCSATPAHAALLCPCARVRHPAAGSSGLRGRCCGVDSGGPTGPASDAAAAAASQGGIAQRTDGQAKAGTGRWAARRRGKAGVQQQQTARVRGRVAGSSGNSREQQRQCGW